MICCSSIQETDICNYADDTTIYACHKNIDNVIWSLENDSTVIIQWFTDNFMKLNTDKCHFMVLGKSSNQNVTVNVGSSVIGNTDEEKLLGVTIDKKLTFETHINKLCKKSGNKLFALSSERCLQRRTSENIRRQEHHNTTQNKRRLLFGLNVDYIYCIKELIFRLGIRGFLRAELT